MNREATLVVGASGATGRLLVEQLLQAGKDVKAIVRPSSQLPSHLDEHQGLTVISANILDLDEAELAKITDGCSSIVSCLGHNLSFKGMFGKPRRLVTDAVRNLHHAAAQGNSDKPLKFILMNTTGNRNHDLNESVSFGQKIILFLLRHLLPPHADNEQAADYLRLKVGQEDAHLEWVAVRPDGLIDEDQVSDYEVHPSPTRSAIFDAGKTSRIHVAHFMSELVTNKSLWDQWKGQMPVIYNLA
jgi:nucleoside-diphosphate-sugar epimerase